jgi:hypothetical protein
MNDVTDRRSSGPSQRGGRFADDEPRRIDRPEPGFFRLRLVKGGPFVPARLWIGPPLDPETREPLDRSPRPMVQIAHFPATDRPDRVDRVWLYGERISVEAFEAMRLRAAWARLHQPDAPIANPLSPVDVSTMRPPF